jgi:hypothetical protein
MECVSRVCILVFPLPLSSKFVTETGYQDQLNDESISSSNTVILGLVIQSLAREFLFVSGQRINSQQQENEFG